MIDKHYNSAMIMRWIQKLCVQTTWLKSVTFFLWRMQAGCEGLIRWKNILIYSSGKITVWLCTKGILLKIYLGSCSLIIVTPLGHFAIFSTSTGLWLFSLVSLVPYLATCRITSTSCKTLVKDRQHKMVWHSSICFMWKERLS